MEFRSTAVITAEPWTSKPVQGCPGMIEQCYDGRWHITQTGRLQGSATEIFLKPVHVAHGHRPAVGQKGTLIETTMPGRQESKFRWEPLDDKPLPVFGWPRWKTLYRTVKS